MTSILAIVSKNWFEKEAKNANGTLQKAGDIYRINRYITTSAFLRPLATGGSLFLVTVRPQERLWLVAVLENPTFQTDQWISQAYNSVPITDITHLTPQLRFSTGKGIHCDPGKLGMALQTPRQLTTNDVLILRKVIIPAIKPAALNLPAPPQQTPPITPSPQQVPPTTPTTPKPQVISTAPTPSNTPATHGIPVPPQEKPVQTIENQNIIPGYKTLTRWRGSPYPFKSPHRKNHMGDFFNWLCRAVGDPGSIPAIRSRRQSLTDKKNSPPFLEFSAKVVKMLHDFSELGDFTNLERMEKVLPLRYVFLLPARHGIVVFSAFSCVLAGEPSKVADYDKLDEYCHTETEIIYEDKPHYQQNIFFKLIREYFNLFTVSKPFRFFLDLPVKMIKGKRTRMVNFKKMKIGAKKVTEKIGILPEWKMVCSPTDILLQTYKILSKNGFLAALQSVRYLFRVSGKFREILIGDPEKIDVEKIKALTQRYLSLDSVLKSVEKPA